MCATGIYHFLHFSLTSLNPIKMDNKYLDLWYSFHTRKWLISLRKIQIQSNKSRQRFTGYFMTLKSDIPVCRYLTAAKKGTSARTADRILTLYFLFLTRHSFVSFFHEDAWKAKHREAVHLKPNEDWEHSCCLQNRAFTFSFSRRWPRNG